jgi:hypothetical protein
MRIFAKGAIILLNGTLLSGALVGAGSSEEHKSGLAVIKSAMMRERKSITILIFNKLHFVLLHKKSQGFLKAATYPCVLPFARVS